MKGTPDNGCTTSLKTAAQPKDLDANHPDQHFREKGHELSMVQLEENQEALIVKNGKQIVIPKGARKELLRELPGDLKAQLLTTTQPAIAHNTRGTVESYGQW